MKSSLIETTFFCDESGSTGTNWLDNDQPYFVYGGWVIKNKAMFIVEKKIKEILATYSGNEIKSTKFFSRRNSWKNFDDIIDTFLRNDSLPFFVILDKRFSVALKIVETFFDSDYNFSLKITILRDMNLKKFLAMIIATNDEILENFSFLIKNGTADQNKMKSIEAQLIDIFRQHKLFNVIKALNNLSNEELKFMTEEFESISDNGTKKTLLTLTLPGIHMLLQHLEQFCLSHGLETVVIHDNLRGYNNEFNEICNIFLQKKVCESVNFGHSIFRSSLNSINSLTFKDSRNEFFIQMADLQCGFISRTFQKIKKRADLNISEKKYLETLYNLHDTHFNWDYVADDKFIFDLQQAILGGKLSSTSPSYDCRSINKQFKKHLK